MEWHQVTCSNLVLCLIGVLVKPGTGNEEIGNKNEKWETRNRKGRYMERSYLATAPSSLVSSLRALESNSIM